MIYVSEEQLQQVEYLINQSKKGNHILFEPKVVRQVFQNQNKAVSDKDAYSVEHHIEQLIVLPSLRKKKAYLKMLDSQTYQLVVRTYFNIVENNIFESCEVRH